MSHLKPRPEVSVVDQNIATEKEFEIISEPEMNVKVGSYTIAAVATVQDVSDVSNVGAVIPPPENFNVVDPFASAKETDSVIMDRWVMNVPPWNWSKLYTPGDVVRYAVDGNTKNLCLFRAVEVGITASNLVALPNKCCHPIIVGTHNVSPYWSLVLLLPRSVEQSFAEFCRLYFYTSAEPFTVDVREASTNLSDLTVRANKSATDGTCLTSAAVMRFQKESNDKNESKRLSRELRAMLVKIMKFNTYWLQNGLQSVMAGINAVMPTTEEDESVAVQVQTSLDPKIVASLRTALNLCDAYIATYEHDDSVHSDEFTLSALDLLLQSQGLSSIDVSKDDKMPSLFTLITQPRTLFLTKNLLFTENLLNHWTSFGVFYEPGNKKASAAKRALDTVDSPVNRSTNSKKTARNTNKGIHW
jgi:hypothetical protein